MTRGVRVRLAAFVVLAAVGVVYVAASYLGVVDTILGRRLSVTATLPRSGGLFVGTEVTERGVKIGKVAAMTPTRDGVRMRLDLAPGTRLPVDAPMHVANLTAVGEQYLDFEPRSGAGPYAAAGHVFAGTAASLPVTTDDLLVRLSRFVDSLNGDDLRTLVGELGAMFQGQADPLRRMVDAGSRLVHTARNHQSQTIALMESGQHVLATQEAHAGDIATFARGLAALTRTLRGADPQLRTILQGGGPAADQLTSLLTGLQPVLPVFLTDLVTVNQVVTARLPALEQTLVTFPKVLAAGFTGTPGDGYGHLNMQFNYQTPACTQGYLPPPWPDPQDTRDLPLYHAKCTDPRAQPGYQGSQPMNQRGVNMVPPVAGGANYRVATYDARTGMVDGGPGAPTVRLGPRGGLGSVLGTDAWKWMLIGPVEGSD
ncbi:MAG: MCE family protein [Marmoricola sp.]